MYRCKVLTDEFLAKVDNYITSVTKDVIDEKVKESKERKLRRSLYYMWNNPSILIDRPQIKLYYEELGLLNPEYTEMLLFPAKGLTLEPRITWVQQVKKISEVKEIFSYETV